MIKRVKIQKGRSSAEKRGRNGSDNVTKLKTEETGDGKKRLRGREEKIGDDLTWDEKRLKWKMKLLEEKRAKAVWIENGGYR